MKRSPAIAALLAILLPGAILGLGFRHLARPDTGLLDDRAAGIQKRLAKAPPNLVVVGNSLARDDIDPKQLTKAVEATGLPAQAVAKLAVGGTPPPVWYAMLKHHVFAEGHQPGVIIVMGTLQSFFWTQVSTVGETQRLRELVGTNDAEILQKATGRRFVVPALERAGTRKVALRDQLLEHWADRVIAFVGAGKAPPTEGGPVGPLVAARMQIDTAFDALFESDGAIDMRLHKRVIPVMQDNRGLVHDEAARPLEDTFLPLFQQLASEQDARLVFVRVPLSASRAHHDPDDRLEEMIAWANAHGVGFVDLSDLSVEERHFRDGKHLNRRGRTLFTAALAEALVAMGTFGEGPLVEAEVPLDEALIFRGGSVPLLAPVEVSALAPFEGCVSAMKRPDLAPYGQAPLTRKRLWNASPLRVRIDGETAPLIPGKVLKKDCKGVALNGETLMVAGLSGTIEIVLDEATPLSGKGQKDVYWIYPGAPLVVGMGEARRQRLLDGGEPLAIDVVVQPLRKRAAPVTVGLDEGEAATIDIRRGRLVETTLNPGHVPSTITIASDDAAVVRLVRLRSGNSTEVLVGDPNRAGELVVRLFEGGSEAARFSGPPPALEAPPPTRDGSKLVWSVPGLKHINTSAVYRASDKYNCSPVRVLKGGSVEKLSLGNCDTVKPGAMCHDGSHVRAVPAAEDSSPLQHFSLGLDPDRVCRTWTFVYGGDTLTVELDDGKLNGLLADLEQLELMAEVLPPVGTKYKAEHWSVSLHAGEGRLVQRRLRVQDFAASIFRLPLNKGRGQKGIRLTFEADPDAPPLILGYALLRERALPLVQPTKADLEALRDRVDILTGKTRGKGAGAKAAKKAGKQKGTTGTESANEGATTETEAAP